MDQIVSEAVTITNQTPGGLWTILGIILLIGWMMSKKSSNLYERKLD